MMQEIIITDDKLTHFNIGNANGNTESSLLYKSNGEFHTICLDQRAKNYQSIHMAASTCVAERDVTNFTITFYTSGLPTKIFFKKKIYFNIWHYKLLSGNRVERFNALTTLINECGYALYDLL